MVITKRYIDYKAKDNKVIKTYKLIDCNGYCNDIITKNYNVKFDEISYFGYLQGYKIYLDNKKYPTQHGNHYTELNLLKAILIAISEKTKSQLNNIYDENSKIVFSKHL